MQVVRVPAPPSLPDPPRHCGCQGQAGWTRHHYMYWIVQSRCHSLRPFFSDGFLLGLELESIIFITTTYP